MTNQVRAIRALNTTQSPLLVDPNLIDPNPYQPPTRLAFTPDQLADLESVKEIGFIHTPIARPHPTQPGRFQMNVGWRRRAAWLLFRKDSPMALDVQELSDEQMFVQSAIENGQRADLSAIEKAAIIQRAVTEFGKSQAQAGKLVGLGSQGAVSNLLRLLKLPEAVRNLVDARQLPERLARQMAPLTAFPVEKRLEVIAKKIAKAAPSEREEIAEEEISDILRNYCKRLPRESWPKDWKPDAEVDIEGKVEIPPACSACPLYIVNREGDFCGRAACYEAKSRLWTQREVNRISKKLGIPVAAEGEPVVALDIDYRNDDRAMEQIRSDSRAEWFRLMPSDDGRRRYYHEQVLGSSAVLLAAFDPKILERKTGEPVPIKTAEETPAQKRRREAAEEREREKRRQEKAALRKAKADIFWLVTHTAEAVAPTMAISGGILEFTEGLVRSRFYSQYNDWPEMKELKANLNRETGKAKGQACELLLRQSIIISEANRELNAFRPEEQFSWPRALSKIETLIVKTFNLQLPTGWDQPPVHHTEANCWVCGKFTSLDHVTKIDESKGWRTDDAGQVACSDECRQVLDGHAHAQRRVTSRKAAKSKISKRGKK